MSLILFILACSGSGGGSDEESAAGCSIDNSVVCIEYIGADVVDTICSQDGTSEDACPTADLVGSCTTGAGTGSESESFYYSPSYDAESAEAACDQMSGEFSAA